MQERESYNRQAEDTERQDSPFDHADNYDRAILSLFEDIELLTIYQAEPKEAPAIAHRLLENIDTAANAFTQMSHSMFEAVRDADYGIATAVADWVAFADAQLTLLHSKIPQGLVPRPDDKQLAEYAWTYVKDNDLDIYNEADLENFEGQGGNWITEGFSEHVRHIVDQVADYAQYPEIVAAYEEARTEERVVADQRAHTARLSTIIDEIVEITDNFDHLKTYFELHKDIFTTTGTVYSTFEAQLESLRSSDEARRSRNNISHWVPSMLHGSAFRDGFTMAMNINHWLLINEDYPLNPETLDPLDSYIPELFSDLQRTVKEGKSADRALCEFDYAVRYEPVLHDFARIVADKLYAASAGHASQKTRQDTGDFYYGFALGYEVYDDYRAYVEQGIDELQTMLDGGEQ